MRQSVNTLVPIVRPTLGVVWQLLHTVFRRQTSIPVWGRNIWSAAALSAAVLMLIGVAFWTAYAVGPTRWAFPHVVYVPVFVAGIAFGYPGGAAAGLLMGLLLGPSGSWDASVSLPQDTAVWIARTIFYVWVGVIVGILADVASMLYERTIRLSDFDPNTGLANGLAFSKALRREVEGGDRHGRLSCLYVDCPTYELVLQWAGPEEAYLLVTELAYALCKAAPPQAAIYQVRGGLFATFLRSAEEGEAVDLAQRLVDVNANRFYVAGTSMAVDCYCGVASLPPGSRDVWAVSHHAAAALRLAQQQDNPVVKYEETTDGYEPNAIRILSELHKALASGSGLSLAFHPIIDSATGRCVTVEALVRWTHAVMGPIPPAHFIPVVERTSMIRPLTHWVLTNAVRQCADWARDGLDVAVAVNVSSRDVRAADFPDFVRDTLDRHHLAPGKLELEITETATMSNTEDSMAALTVLADIGIHISIDDFGTGYSSLERLRRLPADRLKIDQSFVRHVVEDADDDCIVRGSVALAHSMGLKTVAEGVESAVIADRLKGIGCDYLQGFHFTPPLPDADLRAWLARNAHPAGASHPAAA